MIEERPTDISIQPLGGEAVERERLFRGLAMLGALMTPAAIQRSAAGALYYEDVKSCAEEYFLPHIRAFALDVELVPGAGESDRRERADPAA